MIRTALLIATLALSACAAAPEPVVTPAPVQQASTQYLGENVYLHRQSNGGAVLELTREITERTDDVALAALFEEPAIHLVLLRDNDGGYVAPAYAIGRRIRQLGINTTAEGYCASACVDILVAGRERYIKDDAYLGVHSPNIIEAWSIREDLTYYREMGVPQMFSITYAVANEDLRWLDAYEAYANGLVDFGY